MAVLSLAGCDRAIAPPLDSAQGPESQAAKDATGSKATGAKSASPAPIAKSTPSDTAALLSARPQPPTDAEITSGAAHALAAEPALAGANLSVTTDHGVVMLTGPVRSAEQVALAEARAQSPTGVMRVETHITVNPG
jgi:hypothetical protein